MRQMRRVSRPPEEGSSSARAKGDFKLNHYRKATYGALCRLLEVQWRHERRKRSCRGRGYGPEFRLEEPNGCECLSWKMSGACRITSRERSAKAQATRVTLPGTARRDFILLNRARTICSSWT